MIKLTIVFAYLSIGITNANKHEHKHFIQEVDNKGLICSMQTI